MCLEEYCNFVGSSNSGGRRWPSAVGAQQAQSEEIMRRAKSKVQPQYPDLARKMKIAGTVKIEVVVAPNGAVKDAHVVGGHPVLATRSARCRQEMAL